MIIPTPSLASLSSQDDFGPTVLTQSPSTMTQHQFPASTAPTSSRELQDSHTQQSSTTLSPEVPLCNRQLSEQVLHRSAEMEGGGLTECILSAISDCWANVRELLSACSIWCMRGGSFFSHNPLIRFLGTSKPARL